MTVIVASGGYPGAYETGVPIDGLDAADRVEGAVVFHAGTAERDGRVVTAGGRVLSVTGLGATIADARATRVRRGRRGSASRAAFHRTDIAARAAEEE